MKKRILLFTVTAGLAIITLTSGQHGAGAESGYNATGSETGLGNINGCKASGCHGTTATTGITVSLELDSAGVATTHYKAGASYIIKISGTNTTAHTLPRFGFQISCIEGSTAQTTPVNAGTFATSGLPTDIRYTGAITGYFVCNVVEHSTPILATTGSGASGTTYEEAIPWTAPAAGTGTVSFWGALNAVDFTGTVSGDYWNTTKIAIDEWATPSSVTNLLSNVTLYAYPNPVSDNLQLQMKDAIAGTYGLQVIDFTGRIITNENIEVAGGNYYTSLNTANWMQGVYMLVLTKDGSNKVISIMKQ